MEGRLLLDFVVGERPAVLKLLVSEDQPLLVRGDSLLILDFGLYVLDAIAGLDLQGEGLSGQGLYKDLHASSQPKELLASEDQPLLIRGDSFLILEI